MTVRAIGYLRTVVYELQPAHSANVSRRHVYSITTLSRLEVGAIGLVQHRTRTCLLEASFATNDARQLGACESLRHSTDRVLTG